MAQNVEKVIATISLQEFLTLANAVKKKRVLIFQRVTNQEGQTRTVLYSDFACKKIIDESSGNCKKVEFSNGNNIYMTVFQPCDAVAVMEICGRIRYHMQFTHTVVVVILNDGEKL